MVLFWFLLALVLLVAAVVLLRLDSAQRRRELDGAPAEGAASSGPASADHPVAEAPGSRDDGRGDDGPGAIAAGYDELVEPEPVSTGSDPRPAPFQQRAAGQDVSAEAAARTDLAERAGLPDAAAAAAPGDAYAETVRPDPARADSARDDAEPSRREPTGHELAGHETAGHEFADGEPTDREPADHEPADHELYEADTAETADEDHGAPAPAPTLFGRVRALFSGRGRDDSREATGADAEGGNEHEAAVDPLEGSPVVAWLETRGFEPTADPAPRFGRGDFAAGTPPLGAISTGVFRGRDALMGVSGGHTVLALRRPAATGTVVEFARDDVPADPALRHTGVSGRLGVATDDPRTSGVLPTLVDRDRVDAVLVDVPPAVRRIWVEDDWAVATVDGRESIADWDDTVVALDTLVDVLAVLPPAGGRGRSLPVDTDPGAPGAAAGPAADPALGMDGTDMDLVEMDTELVETDTELVETEPGPVETAAAEPVTPVTGDPGPDEHETPATARTISMAAVRDTPESGTPGSDVESGESDADEDGHHGGRRAGLGAAVAGAAAAGLGALRNRRAGHLRVVPEQSDSMRSLTDRPVVRDSGETDPARAGGEADPARDSGETAPASTGGERPAEPVPAPRRTGSTAIDPRTFAAGGAVPVPQAPLDPETEPAQVEPVAPEPGLFDELMNTGAVPANRGDVAADHLAPRPPLPRPSRATGQTVGGEATVPPLASAAPGVGGSIKPLGADGDEDTDEIRSDLEAFEAARLDGGHDPQPPVAERETTEPTPVTESAAEPDGTTPETTEPELAEPATTESETTEDDSDGRHGGHSEGIPLAELLRRADTPAPTRGARRHRAAAEEDTGDHGATGEGRGTDHGSAQARPRSGSVDPDLEETTRFEVPRELRDE